MCGIAGVVTTETSGLPMRPALDAMRTSLLHRGPDDHGTWMSPSGVAGFAHTRLSIFDRSPAGHQPMSILDGRLVATYNGAIYNYRALRESLIRDGAAFRSETDTEVLLHAYARYGVACLDHLRGMFAFAIWDEAARTCVIARDRFGIKPVYYAAVNGRLMFASEVRALVASRLVSRTLDGDGLYGYFRAGSVPEPATLLRDVRCLEAGHCLTWRAGEVSLRRYDHDVAATPKVAVGDAAAAVRAALLESVQGHFAGDAPVGLFLSGGMDSAALVALAKAGGQGELRTFSMAMPGAPEDEGPDARRIAAHFGTQHHEVAIDAARARDLFPAYLAAADQPSIDGLNTFAVAQFARAGGVSVALSGVGADELFGGYPTFRGVPALAAWHRRAAWSGPLCVAAGRALEALAPDGRSRRLGDLLSDRPGLESAYATYRGVFTRAESSKLAAHYGGGPVRPTRDTPVDALRPAIDSDAVSRLEVSRYLRNQLLRDADVMGMAAGVELRTPYLDRQVALTLAGIPARERLQDGKALLARAVPELPRWIVQQRKRCFQFPFARWLGSEWDGVLRTDGALPVPAQTWYRKWSICALEQWMNRMTETAHA